MIREEALKTAKPILFNTDMVRAIFDGRKTVTRRLLKLPNHVEQNENGLYILFADGTCYENQSMEQIKEYIKPPFKAGDYLYVRETWTHHENAVGGIIFKARCPQKLAESKKWHPSIHMPKEAARIFLKVTDVRVERLQEITEEHAQKEGCQGTFVGDGSCMGSGWDVSPVDEFSKLWNSTSKKSDLDRYGWDANPWVWVIEFERMKVE